MQMIAVEFAKDYNKLSPPKPVEFLEAFMLQVFLPSRRGRCTTTGCGARGTCSRQGARTTGARGGRSSTRARGRGP